MKDRIAHIMRAKNLKASDFASLLGIQPSGISHILSGRNQPSLDFVKKIKETFPEYNLDWIVFGTGPMTTSEPFLQPSKPDNPSVDLFTPSPMDAITESAVEAEEAAPSVETPLPTTNPIQKVLVLYADGTFDTYRPH